MKGLMPEMNSDRTYKFEMKRPNSNGKPRVYAHVEVFHSRSGRIARRTSCIIDLNYMESNGLPYWKKELERTQEQIASSFLVPLKPLD